MRARNNGRLPCRLLMAYPTCFLLAVDGTLRVVSNKVAVFSSGGKADPRDGTLVLRKAAA